LQVSKAGVNAVTAVAAAALRRDGILDDSMNPGWVKRDMAGPEATLSPEEGADTAVELARSQTTVSPAASSTSVERSPGRGELARTGVRHIDAASVR
jgi:NAD(P)-dependent dehydrogenase (short-subunit alcohol dehydrogenase family)